MFLLELGGTWVTDCGCITVVDGTRWTVRGKTGDPLNSANWHKYIGVFDHTASDGSTGLEILTARADALHVVVEALRHDCDERAYLPVETVPV